MWGYVVITDSTTTTPPSAGSQEMEKIVNIVIPIYHNDLSGDEILSLERCFEVLGRHTITAIVPQSLDFTPVSKLFPNFSKVERFDDSMFAGRDGYNRLMLMPPIYERFIDWEYILIYQTDVYVFRDELLNWCRKGYDYIGAPWLEKRKHRSAWYKLGADAYTLLSGNKLSTEERGIHRGKVGNGGLSLRRVSTHLDFVNENRELAEKYISKCSYHRYFEDVFWAVEPIGVFRYPTVEEALKFSFDTYPELCYKKNNREIPFGCHGFKKRKSYKFWQQHIPNLGYNWLKEQISRHL